MPAHDKSVTAHRLPIWSPVAMPSPQLSPPPPSHIRTASAPDSKAPTRHRFTNFLIEDILRPNFGCVARPPSPVPDRAGANRVEDAPGAGNSERPAGKTTGRGHHNSLWPAWVYCTRYSDRPSAGPRSRKLKKERTTCVGSSEAKRIRTAFTSDQLAALKQAFSDGMYLKESQRERLAGDLQLNESQVKIWFQNKRAKQKKSCGRRHGLARQLIEQGLYNHTTVVASEPHH